MVHFFLPSYIVHFFLPLYIRLVNELQGYDNPGGVTINDAIPESTVQRSRKAHAVKDSHAQSLLIPVDHAIGARAVDPH